MSKRHAECCLTRFYMLLLGAGALLMAQQVLSGWIVFGERINVSRRDVNFIEWVVVVVFLLLAAAAWRSAWSLWRRDRAGWPWSQWVSFFSVIVGVAFLMKALVARGHCRHQQPERAAAGHAAIDYRIVAGCKRPALATAL